MNCESFLEGRLKSIQSEQSEKFSKSSDWLKKASPPKSHFCFDHVNRLIIVNPIYRLLLYLVRVCWSDPNFLIIDWSDENIITQVDNVTFLVKKNKNDWLFFFCVCSA